MTDKISVFLDVVNQRAPVPMPVRKSSKPVRLKKVSTPKQPKKSIHLRVDADVLDFFKSKGKGHLTRMNDVLRSHMETRK